MNENKMLNIINKERAKEEMKKTGKKYYNENFIFYAYIKDDLRILDLRPLPKIKVNGKMAIHWKATKNIEVDCMIESLWYKITVSYIEESKPSYLRVCTGESHINISPSHLREIQISKLLIKEKTLWDIAINYRSYFTDVQQAKNILPYSRNEVELYCDNCEHTHITTAGLIANNPIYRCPLCGDNTSNNEKWVWAFLLGNDKLVEPQKTFANCLGDKRALPFDFYIKEDNMLIEVQGIGHYSPTFGEKSFKETQKNDRIKKEFCKQEGINLICINASEGTQEAIVNSDLKEYVNTNINIDDILAKLNIDSQYPVKEIVSLYVDEKKSIIEISEIVNHGTGTITGILKRQKVHVPNQIYKDLYDRNQVIQQLKDGVSIADIMAKNNISYSLVYKIASDNDLSNRRKTREVICVETGKPFKTMADASRWCGTSSSNIRRAILQGKRAGTNPETGLPVTWKVIGDIEPLTSGGKKGANGTKVKCLNNEKEFNTMKEASDYAGLKSTSKIGMVCNGKRKTAGKHPITNEPLRWEIIEEKEQVNSTPIKKVIGRPGQEVLCVTTGKKYKSLRDASNKTGVDRGKISACLKNKVESAGILEDGTPLYWEYVD